MADDNIIVLFNGFLKLRNLDKLKLVNSINEYFDSNEREKIRESNDMDFASLIENTETFKCIACGR